MVRKDYLSFSFILCLASNLLEASDMPPTLYAPFTSRGNKSMKLIAGNRYPGVGIMIALFVSALMWVGIAYLVGV